MPMRIAVISDTHDRLPGHVADAIRDADEIWHLGDVTGEEIIDELRALGRPLRVIRGNCDCNLEWPQEERFTLCGRRFLLIHAPPGIAPEGIDLLLHGHTHVPRDEKIGGTRFLNPGTVGKPKSVPASYAWLKIRENDGAVTWEIVRV